MDPILKPDQVIRSDRDHSGPDLTQPICRPTQHPSSANTDENRASKKAFEVEEDDNVSMCEKY